MADTRPNRGGRNVAADSVERACYRSASGIGNDATLKIEKRGGRVTFSLIGETDYVVVGDDPGSTLDDAKAKGVEMLDRRRRRHARPQP